MVFKEFTDWMTKKTAKISEMNRTQYQPGKHKDLSVLLSLSSTCLQYAVLVSHNGYVYNFRLLISEMKRHDIDSSIFREQNISFSDTLDHLRKVV